MDNTNVCEYLFCVWGFELESTFVSSCRFHQEIQIHPSLWIQIVAHQSFLVNLKIHNILIQKHDYVFRLTSK